MEFKNCTLDKKYIINNLSIDDLLGVESATNLYTDGLTMSPYSSMVYILMSKTANALPDFIFNLVEVDKYLFDITVTPVDSGETISCEEANLIQNELYDFIYVEEIIYNDNSYDSFTYMYDQSVYEYDIVDWPQSQDLVDNGESIILINDEFADKMFNVPAYFVMK